MSAGLMSCVRENSPPTKMENSGAASLSSKSQESHKRRRRFHPLRNLRRIFRRRTLAHADSIRPISQQHTNCYHRNEAGSTPYSNDLSHLSTTRSLSAQSIDADVLPDDLSDFQLSHPIRTTNQSELLAATKRAYYTTKDNWNGKLLNHLGAMDMSTEAGSDLTRELIDYQRSLSEGRLLDNDFSRETLSHSHDSVFSESATASSLSIVLKAELADALRKRKSRSNASEEDLGLPRSPSRDSRNGSHHVVDGQVNSTSIGLYHHHGSMGLLSMNSEMHNDSMELSNCLSTSKSSYEISKHDNSDDIFPPEISFDSSRDSDTKLSHSAARHKMAIRPKKKGPSRLPRKPNESANGLPRTYEVNEGSFKSSSNVSESLASKSRSLPRGVASIGSYKTIGEHSNQSMTLNKQTVTKFAETTTSCELDGTERRDEIECKTNVKYEERTHSEEGFFRRFINRSGRKQKKDRDNTFEPDVSEASNNTGNRVEASKPAIKKSAELSIINVLSNARANEKPIGAKGSLFELSTDELNASPESLVMKNDKLRSGPIARQRYTKEIKESADSEVVYSSDLIDHGLKKESAPATSYLRFSPTESVGSQCDGESDKFVYSSHHRSEEMLNTISSNHVDSMAFDGFEDLVSLPKSVWPSETQRVTSNVARNGYGWGQCQQKISKMSGEQQQQAQKKLSYSRGGGKMVEKSKSFRLYTKNFGNESNAQTRQECKSTLCPSLPDLNAANRSPLARPSRYSNNRDNSQSLRFLNSSANHLDAAGDSAHAKWTPTRSSSSSRITDRYLNNRFEINDMNLIPTSKLYSTLNTSDEIASYDIDKDADAHSNINEIEDNIDKIMKSSVVTVLKNSPTVDMYQIKSTGNKSLTTITPRDESEAMALNMATVENPPLLRHSTTAKMDLQVPSSSSPPKKIHSDLPEFMQIQLNRVAAARPKSCIEYSSNVSPGASSQSISTQNTFNDEDKERRFSNESIEISDKKKVVISASAMNVSNSNLNKSTESLKSGFGRQSRDSIGSHQISRGSSTSELHKTSINSDNHSSDDCLDIEMDDDSDGNIVIERRKSVSDKKLKFEQQIEKIQAEVKRSTTIADKCMISTRKMSLEDDSMASSTVVLRSKKSLKSSNPDDATPELMKVFARRSLKIKDTDDYLVPDDAEHESPSRKLMSNDSVSGEVDNSMNRINNAKNTITRFNMDSDKENHVSSGAQSSISKVGNYIKPAKELHDKLSDSPPKREPVRNEVDMTSVKSIGKLFSSTNRFASSNSLGPQVSNNNYRNSTAFFDSLNSTANSQIRANANKVTNDVQSAQDNGVILIIEKNNHINNNEGNNNKFNTNSSNNPNHVNNNAAKKSSPIVSNKIGKIQSSIVRNPTMPNINTFNGNINEDVSSMKKVQPTVANTSDASASNGSQDIEYKGILERKAEWEKRASQVFK